VKDEFNTVDTVYAIFSPVPQVERRTEIKLHVLKAFTSDGDE
jgi:hypothetical protein